MKSRVRKLFYNEKFCLQQTEFDDAIGVKIKLKTSKIQSKEISNTEVAFATSPTPEQPFTLDLNVESNPSYASHREETSIRPPLGSAPGDQSGKFERKTVHCSSSGNYAAYKQWKNNSRFRLCNTAFFQSSRQSLK